MLALIELPVVISAAAAIDAPADWRHHKDHEEADQVHSAPPKD